MERLAFVFETSWNFYELEQWSLSPAEASLQEIPELSVSPHFDDYEYLPKFEEYIEEPEVKQVSRFFQAIKTWFEETQPSSDVAFAHPGGWIF